MLTSSLVVPNALNLKLPGKKSSVTVNSQPPTISINSSGAYYLNGTKISLGQVERVVRDEKKKNKSRATIKIQPNPKANTEHVVAVMDVAYRWGIQAVLDD